MKNLTLNKGIQLLWFLLLAIVILFALLIDLGFIVYGLFLFFLIGVNQFGVSSIRFIVERKNSEYRYHFFVSSIYLIILVLLNFSGIGIESNKLIYYPLVAIPAGLAIYFWYLTFRKSEEITTQNHNVFDL